MNLVTAKVFAVELPDYSYISFSHDAVFTEPEVKAIRAKTGLTQGRFADVVGISKRTPENLEQRRRHPTGPARALL